MSNAHFKENQPSPRPQTAEAPEGESKGSEGRLLHHIRHAVLITCRRPVSNWLVGPAWQGRYVRLFEWKGHGEERKAEMERALEII